MHGGRSRLVRRRSDRMGSGVSADVGRKSQSEAGVPVTGVGPVPILNVCHVRV
jgi:hypothetical protein